jgi:hypothetical protein
MRTAYSAVNDAGCAPSELFKYFEIAENIVCDNDYQCDTNQAVGCITDLYQNFMSAQSTCDQAQKTSRCLQGSCRALPAEATNYFNTATTMICANKKCDIRQQVMCVADAVKWYDSVEDVIAKPQKACGCANSVLECATQVTAGYVDQSILFQVSRLAQSICSPSCNTEGAARCLTTFVECRSRADDATKCNSCNMIAESCLAATLCVDDESSNQIKSLVAQTCPAIPPPPTNPSNNGNNGGTDSSASSLIVSTSALVILAFLAM